MTEKKRDGKAVFLDSEDGRVYTKVWGGLSFRIEKQEDKSVKIKIHDQDTEISTPRTNDHGTYWMANVYGGKGFVSFRPSKTGEGDYCLLTMTEDVRLPRNPNKPAGAKKPFTQKKAYAKKSASPW